MKRIAVFAALPALAAVLAVSGAAWPLPQRRPAVVAFTNVSVIPMDAERVLQGQTVVVRDGRIAAIGPAGSASVPDGAIGVDGSGKFLIPALAEMHAHVPPGPDVPDAEIDRTLRLYALHGLGTIRGMLGDPRHLPYRERANAGAIVSPSIYTSGPSLNGQSVPTPEAAEQAVRDQKAAGYDLLKIHPGLTLEVFNTIDRVADEVDIPYSGHVPLAVGLRRALEGPYGTIDHLDGYIEAMAGDAAKMSQFFGVNLMHSVDESRIPELVAMTKRSGVAQVPTQVLFDNLLGDETVETLSNRAEMVYVPKQTIENWIGRKQKMGEIPQTARRKFLTLRRRLIKDLHDAGVLIVNGSDAPQVWNVPGISTHRELKSLVDAGLTPYQALTTATVNVARYFGTTKERGTIEPGKRADVVLVGADPLAAITNTQKIEGVMLSGRWIGAAERTKMLEGARKQ